MQPSAARAVLGVAEDAEWPAVRAAYRRLIRAAHPDVRGGLGTAAAARLNEAYAVLLQARRVPPAPAPNGSPAPPPPTTAPKRTAPATSSIDAGTIVLGCPVDEAFGRVIEAGHLIGEVTYVDRSCSITEIVLDVDGEACSLVVTFQGRAAGTEAFCTLEALERVASLDPTRVVARLVDAIRTA